jgi:D-alanine-D-alanine ligase
MKIGLTYDLVGEHPPYFNAPPDYYGEFHSEESIRILKETLEGLGHEVDRIGNIKQLVHFIVSQNAVDIVFNVAEGIWGRSREAQVPALLEAFQIPYTFSDPLTLSVCLDKAVTKRLMQSEGIATPAFHVISDPSQFDQKIEASLKYPLFVKPLREGTSKGINSQSIIENRQELFSRVQFLISLYKQPVMVEEYLPGREFTIGIIGSGAEAHILGAVEIIVTDSQEKVYGFLQKEECEDRVLYKPVETRAVLDTISELALRAYRAVDCQDAGRVDIRFDKKGDPHFLEINPLPGLHPITSDLSIIATQVGVAYEQLIAEILRSAFQRWSL